MASIDKRPDGRYRARWREYPGGPQEVRHFARTRDADQFLDAIRGDLAHGMYVDPAGDRTLFQDYAERWRSVQVHRSGTTTQVETCLRLHPYPYVATRQLGAIRRSDLQAWVKELTAVLAPRSVELVYRWVSTIFKAAVGDRLLAASPCIGITLPKCNDAEVAPLSVNEVGAMIAAVPDRLPSPDRVRCRDGTPAGRVLRPHRGPRGLPTSPGARRPPAHRPGQYGLVFTSRTGNPLRRTTLGSMWHRARPVAGLPDWATFHDLRHFYPSLPIAKGCSVKAVQRRLGHQSAMETLDTYGHLWPNSDDETRNAVDLVLAGVTRAG